MKRQSGFSLIEMTLVLGILAIGAITAMRVANSKMEETITARAVSDLSVAAEAAYECYVADECATGDPKGWEFPEVWKKTYLPVAFPLGLYVFSASNGVDKQATITVDMGNAKRAQRVARAFGSIARDNTNTVIVTLRIPGTESAITSAVNDIKDGIKDGFDGDNILDQVTIGSATITAQAASILEAIVGQNCPWGIGVNSEGAVMCAQIKRLCSYRGETLYSGETSANTWIEKSDFVRRKDVCGAVTKYVGRTTYGQDWNNYHMRWRCNAKGKIEKFKVSYAGSGSSTPNGC